MSFPNLYQYLTVIFLVGLIMNLYNPMYYYAYLSLDVRMILSGQIWRLFTFIFYFPSDNSSILFSLLFIYIYYSFTKTLNIMWRPFKFNFYMFISYISLIIGALICHFIFGIDFPPLTTAYQFFSIFMAFALSFPDANIYLYFLIPIKAKYIAYIEIILYTLYFIISGITGRVEIICSVVNVVLFFAIWKNKF